MKENIIPVGVIAGPKEPELHIHSFSKALIDDLREIWEVVSMTASENVTPMVRAALLCIGGDIPAACVQACVFS